MNGAEGRLGRESSQTRSRQRRRGSQKIVCALLRKQDRLREPSGGVTHWAARCTCIGGHSVADTSGAPCRLPRSASDVRCSCRTVSQTLRLPSGLFVLSSLCPPFATRTGPRGLCTNAAGSVGRTATRGNAERMGDVFRHSGAMSAGILHAAGAALVRGLCC